MPKSNSDSSQSPSNLPMPREIQQPQVSEEQAATGRNENSDLAVPRDKSDGALGFAPQYGGTGKTGKINTSSFDVPKDNG